MKANIDTFIQAIKLTCKAHRNAPMTYHPDEGQIGIGDCAVPTLADVKTICMAFFDTSRCVEASTSWNFITIYLDCVDFLPEVNIETLDSALPYGWIEKIKD